MRAAFFLFTESKAKKLLLLGLLGSLLWSCFLGGSLLGRSLSRLFGRCFSSALLSSGRLGWLRPGESSFPTFGIDLVRTNASDGHGEDTFWQPVNLVGGTLQLKNREAHIHVRRDGTDPKVLRGVPKWITLIVL